MDVLRTGDGFSDEEIAYLKSGGADPLPPSEPEPEPAAESPDDTAEPVAEAEGHDDPEVIEADAPEEDANKGRKVKYGAYLRQKAEADAARKERDETRQKLEAAERAAAVQNARIEERFRQWQASQQQAQPPQPQQAPPDRNEDPLAYMAWQDERLSRLEQHTNQTAQQRHQAAQIAQLDNAYRADNHQAAREMPEYPDAYNYLLKSAQRTVEIQNRHFSPEQVRAAVELQERQLAAAAMQQGVRPAAMIVQMAQERGWAPKGQAVAAAPQVNPDAEQAKLDAVARGQAQNRTLSTAGRPGGNTATMTLDRFLSLSDDEAREWSEKNPGGLARIGGQ